MSTSSNKTIAKNTIVLYLRMILSIIVSLYTSRVVLQTLGVDDFGIYGVVGGIVAMFSFLNSAMAGATSRFLTFEMGKENTASLPKVFSSAMIVHICIAFVVFILAETLGLWVLCNKLVIPEGRMLAAHVVYQCSVIGMFIGFTQVPYNAVIIAHEKMDVYAYVEILHVLLKLFVVFLLLVGNFDKLIVYAILMLMVSFIVACVYRIYCIRNYQESHFSFIWDKTLLVPMLSFSSWNAISSMGYSLRVYASNIVLNMFFGTVVNAAVGIASTVQGVILGFVANVNTAVRPQIIKQYSTGNIEDMVRIVKMAIRLNLFLVALLTIPLYVHASYILQLWLGEIPSYAVEFTQLLLFSIYIICIAQIVIIAIHATGKIKEQCLFKSLIDALTPLIVYLFLFFSPKPIYGYVVVISCQVLSCFVDFIVVHKKIKQISFWGLMSDFIKSVAIFGGTVLILSCLELNVCESFFNMLLSILFELIFIAIVFILFMFGKYERERLWILLNHFVYSVKS